MCSGVSGRCAPADCGAAWWVRYTSIPPRAQMAADGAFLPLIGDRRLLKIAPYLRFAIPRGDRSIDENSSFVSAATGWRGATTAILTISLGSAATSARINF